MTAPSTIAPATTNAHAEDSAPAATTDRGVIASVRLAGDAIYRAALRATAAVADKLRVTPKSVRTTAILAVLVALVAILVLTKR